MVNCWVLLPEQWWQADAVGRLLSSSQQAATALWPEYLASLHLALSFVRLIHQQAFTQPVETADSRRQRRSPGEGWGGSAGDTQSASHTGISAEPTRPGASAIPDLCMSGVTWGLKKVFKARGWAPGLGSLPLPQRVFHLLFSFEYTSHTHTPAQELWHLPAVLPRYLLIVSVEYFFTCFCIYSYIFICLHIHLYSLLYISYTCILLCL